MKKLVQVTKRRSVQLYLPLAPARPIEAAPVGTPQRPPNDFKTVFIRLIAAVTRLVGALWNLLVLWLVVPAAGAGLYWLLDHFRFPYPGLGILLGMSLAAQLLHRGADSPYLPTGQGLLLYFAVVTLGNRLEIFSSASYAFDNFLDITLLARGEPITPYHWLGLACLGFSSVIFDWRQFCSPSCPGHCLGGYRRRLHVAAGATEAVGTALLAVLSCLMAVALRIASLVFAKCKATLPMRTDAAAPTFRAEADEQVTVVTIEAPAAVKGELAAPVETANLLKPPASPVPVPISRQRLDATPENSTNKTKHTKTHMKNIPLFLLAAHLSASAIAGDRLVMVAPFDNLSDVRRHIDYEMDTGAVKGNPRKRYQIDRYSHTCREFLEDTVSSIPGVRPVERAQFDRVMLEVAGRIHDGAVDPEKVQQVAIRLGADAIIMGTILDLRQSTTLYEGYARIRTTTYSASIRVRLIDLTKDADSQKIVAGIAASYRVTGSCVVPETPYFQTYSSDAYFAALVDALRHLENDEAFKARIAPKVTAQSAPGLVNVTFSVMPTNCSVFLRGQSGWRYLGGTPLARSLPAGLEVPIRVEKEGFAPWETIIVPETDLRITHELHRQTEPKTNTP